MDQYLHHFQCMMLIQVDFGKRQVMLLVGTQSLLLVGMRTATLSETLGGGHSEMMVIHIFLMMTKINFTRFGL